MSSTCTGANQGLIKTDERVNDLCTTCHMQQAGPFVFEHAPVTESCLTCHSPHGTVANNLLKQGEPFLCLQCHEMHFHNARRGQRGSRTALPSGGSSNPNGNLSFMAAFNTRCSNCHNKVHGSDLPSQGVTGRRQGPHAVRRIIMRTRITSVFAAALAVFGLAQRSFGADHTAAWRRDTGASNGSDERRRAWEGIFRSAARRRSTDGNQDRVGEYQVTDQDALASLGTRLWGEQNGFRYDLTAINGGDAPQPELRGGSWTSSAS